METTALRRFAPPIWAIVLTVATVGAFVSLGLWQLDRADQKRALADQFEQGANEAIELRAGTLDQLRRYQQVIVRGRYDASRQVLLDNMPSNNPRGPGRPGYRVWTPLLLEDGGMVLIDRGWVMAGATREQLPNVSVPEDIRTVRARVDELPRPGFRMGTAQPQGRWPEVLYYPTAEELSALYGAQAPRRILLLEADETAGYERIWQAESGFRPERHLGYAVQWFALAAAVVAVFVVVNVRARKRS